MPGRAHHCSPGGKRMGKRTLSPNYKRATLGSNIIVPSVDGGQVTHRYQILQNRKRQKLRHSLTRELGGNVSDIDKVVDNMLPSLEPRAPITDSNVRAAVGQVRELRRNRAMVPQAPGAKLLSPNVKSSGPRALPVRPRARSCGDRYKPVPDEWAAIITARQQAQDEAVQLTQSREAVKKRQIRQTLLDQMKQRDERRRHDHAMNLLDGEVMVERVGNYRADVRKHQSQMQRRKHEICQDLHLQADRALREKQEAHTARLASEHQDLKLVQKQMDAEVQRQKQKKIDALQLRARMYKENEALTRRKAEQKKIEFANDIRLMHEYNRLQDEQERKRQQRMDNLKVTMANREAEVQTIEVARAKKKADEGRRILEAAQKRDAERLANEETRQRRQVFLRLKMRKDCLEQVQERHTRGVRSRESLVADRAVMTRKVAEAKAQEAVEMQAKQAKQRDYRAYLLKQAEDDRLRKMRGSGMSSYERAVNSNYLKHYQYGQQKGLSLADSCAMPSERVDKTRRSNPLSQTGQGVVFGQRKYTLGLKGAAMTMLNKDPQSDGAVADYQKAKRAAEYKKLLEEFGDRSRPI